MYKECIEILQLLKDYLQQAVAERTWLDNCVDYWIPLIGAVILVSTSLAAAYKYFKEKNRDLNEKILKEVYAPLFQYIIKQEFIRKDLLNMMVDEYPIISLTKKKINDVNDITEIQQILQKNDLLTVKESINFGLAPQNLLVLLNIYEILDSNISSFSDEEYLMVEMRLRTEIIEGYLKYSRKLGIDKKKHIISYKDKKIIFNLAG